MQASISMIHRGFGLQRFVLVLVTGSRNWKSWFDFDRLLAAYYGNWARKSSTRSFRNFTSVEILAKELKVPVIALSQLSRGVEQRQDKRPVLSDIRESGSIEQDADIVAFLYRDDYYERGGEEEEGIPNNKVEVIIEKNRSGARGTVELIFQKEYNKFSSISKREEQR